MNQILDIFKNLIIINKYILRMIDLGNASKQDRIAQWDKRRYNSKCEYIEKTIDL